MFAKHGIGAIVSATITAINLTRHAFHGDWNYTISPAAQ